MRKGVTKEPLSKCIMRPSSTRFFAQETFAANVLFMPRRRLAGFADGNRIRAPAEHYIKVCPTGPEASTATYAASVGEERFKKGDCHGASRLFRFYRFCSSRGRGKFVNSSHRLSRGLMYTRKPNERSHSFQFKWLVSLVLIMVL